MFEIQVTYKVNSTLSLNYARILTFTDVVTISSLDGNIHNQIETEVKKIVKNKKEISFSLKIFPIFLSIEIVDYFPKLGKK